MKPKVLALVRWPVGGIRTWCRYVYRDKLFQRFAMDLLMPGTPEARALVADLADTNVRLQFVQGPDTSRNFLLSAWRHLADRQIALVHSHGFTSAAVAMGPVFVTRVPHLVTTHDVILEDQYRDTKGRLARFGLARVLGAANCVQAVSSASATNLHQAFPTVFRDKGKLVTVANGIETSRFLTEDRINLRELHQIPDDALLVGFFGRFMGQKGFKYLMQAVELDRNEVKAASRPLYVLAVGGDGFVREEQEAIRAKGLESRFRFHEFNPNIAGLMRGVDVVAMPSLWEACGLLAMEALVAGVPLVVGDCDALVEICRGSPAQVVPKAHSGALLQAIREQSHPDAQVRAEAYRSSAASRFDVRSTSAGIAGLYENLIGTSGK